MKWREKNATQSIQVFQHVTHRWFKLRCALSVKHTDFEDNIKKQKEKGKRGKKDGRREKRLESQKDKKRKERREKREMNKIILSSRFLSPDACPPTLSVWKDMRSSGKSRNSVTPIPSHYGLSNMFMLRLGSGGQASHYLPLNH